MRIERGREETLRDRKKLKERGDRETERQRDSKIQRVIER